MKNDIVIDIEKFFNNIYVLNETSKGYKYASYKKEWLNEIGLTETSADESKTAQTTKKLQKHLKSIYGERIKTEALVAEGMTLRFENANNESESLKIDSTKLQAFDILDLENGVAIEISLSDAFSEFFKDVLKALLDSRVKDLYICMRNHYYKGANKSGYIKVADSEMVRQYISLAKLYKLNIHLIDLFPICNKK